MMGEFENSDLFIKFFLLELMWAYICFMNNHFKMLHLVTEIVSATVLFFKTSKFFRKTMKKFY